jgi:hypothetical protein
MAVSLASLKRAGGTPKPPRNLVYGTHGIGKTNLAAGAPAPVFIQTEDGLADPRLGDIPTFGILKTFGEVFEAVGSLYTEDHEFKTAVIDTVDWLEPLVWAETCVINGWRTIEEPGFGKGYIAAVDVWRSLIEGLNSLRDDKGMTIIMLAHAHVKRYEAPDSEPYDRYLIKLQDRASAILQENVDCVFFANYRTSIVRDKRKGEKEGQGRTRGVGGGNRVIYTEERPAFLAKNRYSMPDSIALPDDASMAWSAVAAHIPYFQAAA